MGSQTSMLKRLISNLNNCCLGPITAVIQKQNKKIKPIKFVGDTKSRKLNENNKTV